MPGAHGAQLWLKGPLIVSFGQFTLERRSQLNAEVQSRISSAWVDGCPLLMLSEITECLRRIHQNVSAFCDVFRATFAFFRSCHQLE